mmetsp:Transcript_1097/g.2624  ORF Transcript_1097/g.2624 Transcript_1097/m.2624 type:complete len:524 (+) Transcript_1097:720-2291(+)
MRRRDGEVLLAALLGGLLGRLLGGLGCRRRLGLPLLVLLLFLLQLPLFFHVRAPHVKDSDALILQSVDSADNDARDGYHTQLEALLLHRVVLQVLHLQQVVHVRDHVFDPQADGRVQRVAGGLVRLLDGLQVKVTEVHVKVLRHDHLCRVDERVDLGVDGILEVADEGVDGVLHLAVQLLVQRGEQLVVVLHQPNVFGRGGDVVVRDGLVHVPIVLQELLHRVVDELQPPLRQLVLQPPAHQLARVDVELVDGRLAHRQVGLQEDAADGAQALGAALQHVQHAPAGGHPQAVGVERAQEALDLGRDVPVNLGKELGLGVGILALPVLARQVGGREQQLVQLGLVLGQQCALVQRRLRVGLLHDGQIHARVGKVLLQGLLVVCFQARKERLRGVVHQLLHRALGPHGLHALRIDAAQLVEPRHARLRLAARCVHRHLATRLVSGHAHKQHAGVVGQLLLQAHEHKVANLRRALGREDVVALWRKLLGILHHAMQQQRGGRQPHERAVDIHLVGAHKLEDVGCDV